MSDKIPQKKRIDYIDATRAVALFLILYSHCEQSFFGTASFMGDTWLDGACWKLFRFISFHKSMMMFAFLFGLSFHLQGQRGNNRETGGSGTKKRFAVRLLWLAAFGMGNSLFDTWDMLLPFALCGCILLIMPRHAVWVGIAISCGLLAHPMMCLETLTGIADPIDTATKAYRPMPPDTSSANWLTLAAWNLSTHIPVKLIQLYSCGRIADIAGMFLLGATMGRSGILQPGKSRQAGRLAGVLAAVLCGWFLLRRHFPEPVFKLCQLQMNCIQTVSYVLICCLLFQTGIMARATVTMAVIGRSTLTCYISQGWILSWLMYGWGLGLGSTTGCFLKALLCIGIYAIQLVFCLCWLRYFSMAPMEIAWRRLVKWTSPD